MQFKTTTVDEKTILILDEGIIPFHVRMIMPGDKYGLMDRLTHVGVQPLVEVYDARYPHTKFGQFITRYYLSTLYSGTHDYGLCLNESIPEWSLSVVQHSTLVHWAESMATK